MTTNLYKAAKAALDALTCAPDDGFDPGHRCSHCDDYVDRNGPVREMLRLALAQTSEDAHLADKLDAERYQHIKKNITPRPQLQTMLPTYKMYYLYGYEYVADHAGLDESIDAAIARADGK